MPKVQIEGLDLIVDGLNKFPGQVIKNLSQAGREIAERIVYPTEGIKKYPNSTIANLPPTPYYIRGRGTQLATRNLGNSERYGTQFYVRQDGLNTILGNRASYAAYLTDEDKQSSAMARIGWKKLVDVIRSKAHEIKAEYQKWVDYTIRELRL